MRPICLPLLGICGIFSLGCVSVWPNDHLRAYPHSAIVRLCRRYHFAGPSSLWANDDGTVVFLMEIARYSREGELPPRILKFSKGAPEPELIVGFAPGEIGSNGQPIAQRLPSGDYLFPNSARLSNTTLMSNSGEWALIRRFGRVEVVNVTDPGAAAYTFDGNPQVDRIVSRSGHLYIFSSPWASGRRQRGWELAGSNEKLSIVREFSLPGNFEDMDLDLPLVLASRELYPLWWAPMVLDIRTGIYKYIIIWPPGSYRVFLYADWFGNEFVYP